MTSTRQKIKKQTIKSIGWKFVEQFSIQAIRFGVIFFIARLLEPVTFGEVALLQGFIALIQPFIDGGFGMALIQRDKLEQRDCCSVFWCNITIALAGCLLIWVAAPFIAGYYQNEALITPLRWLSLPLLTSSVTTVHKAYLNRDLEFDKQCWISWGSLVVYGAVGIVWGYLSPSVWALVGATLAGELTRMLMTFFLKWWMPELCFSWQSLKSLFSFGSNLLFNNLLSIFDKNITALLIGKVFGVSDIAYYNNGIRLPNIVVCTIDGTLSSVLFPVFSKKQKEKDFLQHYCRRSIQLSFFCTLPALVLLGILGKPLIVFLLTPKWLPCVPYIWIAGITYLSWVFVGILQQCVNAIGRSSVVFRVKAIFTVLNIGLIFITWRWGIIFMLTLSAVLNYVVMLTFALIVRHYIALPVGAIFMEQWKPAVSCLSAAAVILLLFKIEIITSYAIVQLIVGGIVFGCFYLGVNYLLRTEALFYFFSLVKDFIQNRMGNKKRDELCTDFHSDSEP